MHMTVNNCEKRQPGSHATLMVFYSSLIKHNKTIYLPALWIFTIATVNALLCFQNLYGTDSCINP